MKKKNVTCIIQARIQSTRLPAKILLPGYNKPLLLHLIERLKKSKLIKKIIVATTTNKIDETIFDLCRHNKIEVFRGNPLDLLDRYYKCSKKYKVKNILRITSDCPLIDYKIVDNVIKKYFLTNSDYTSNIHPPSFPDGFDIEIFNFKTLKETFHRAKKNFEREHVTPYMWDKPGRFKITNYSSDTINYYNKYRLTIDYVEDFFVISKIFNELYSKNKYFTLEDIIKYLKQNMKILINKKFIKVNWFRHHLKELRTISKKDTKLNFYDL